MSNFAEKCGAAALLPLNFCGSPAIYRSRITVKIDDIEREMKMKQQIMIVEDNEINREMLKAILSDEYKILEAENGQEALDMLESVKENIALIILDVMMPVMDGYTFLDIVRKDPVLSLIPVIVSTQSDGESSEIAALEHGSTSL